ncbi:hypothetical protein EC973_006944 [Apophysomyces ossiformis]|uniref:ACB domain-containing protein n=1 Tax=Apophysomyces ossiformis TaxID=679940 RepID=A0A8H7EQP0_9FUNG|nr:hypothetical protein EC973_006944 [Apophysomyces ossiformis]
MPSAEFEAAAEQVKALTKSPNSDELLQLYSLFKQATVGDVNTDRPGIMDFKGRAKWDAWLKLKGTPSEEAEQKYIALVEELKVKYQ